MHLVVATLAILQAVTLIIAALSAYVSDEALGLIAIGWSPVWLLMFVWAVKLAVISPSYDPLIMLMLMILSAGLGVAAYKYGYDIDRGHATPGLM